MAWIQVVSEPPPSQELEKLYAAVADPQSGKVDNILRIHSLHPEGLEAHAHLYRAVMRGTRALPKVEREMIALVVSRINECHY